MHALPEATAMGCDVHFHCKYHKLIVVLYVVCNKNGNLFTKVNRPNDWSLRFSISHIVQDHIMMCTCILREVILG